MTKPKIVQIAASGTSALDGDGGSFTYNSVFALLDDGRLIFTTMGNRSSTTEWTVLDPPDPASNMFLQGTRDLVGE